MLWGVLSVRVCLSELCGCAFARACGVKWVRGGGGVRACVAVVCECCELGEGAEKCARRGVARTRLWDAGGGELV